MDAIAVYLETGQKRSFAAAVDWPGWSRSGRDEGLALQALYDYAPRYAHVAHLAALDFVAPDAASAFTVIERVAGSASTDFGAPGSIPECDTLPVGAGELKRLEALLAACWQTFDAVAQAAAGRELARGPRGGGRDLATIVDHVLEAEAGYLSRVAWKLEARADEDVAARQARTRQAVQAALAAAAAGEVAPRGPRGGLRWPPRYFARRVAWHVLDHAWEIEDRGA